MERDALSEQEGKEGNGDRGAHREKIAARSDAARRRGKKRRRRRMRRRRRRRGGVFCSGSFAAYEDTKDRQVRPYVVRDNDRSRWPYTSFLPSRLAPPRPREAPRSWRKRYRISCVYLGMRDRAARNSIRRSRTEDSLALQDWPGSVRLVLCARTTRMIEDGFTKERMNPHRR